ncbi:hypothetical protein ACFQY5_41350 [Paeniroseomonas aquatica]|uniref:hypothetical protein n=1 Tax=Paeniroseomonas aquatica TaxID=373043 RepID=UPI00361645DE
MAYLTCGVGRVFKRQESIPGRGQYHRSHTDRQESSVGVGSILLDPKRLHLQVQTKSLHMGDLAQQHWGGRHPPDGGVQARRTCAG